MAEISMKLNSAPFEKIKSGVKQYELRLYDEKRREIEMGDFITFTKLDETGERLKAKVTGLLRFPTFWEMVNEVDYRACGWDLEHMHPDKTLGDVYTKEQESKYGVLGIKLELVK